MKVCYFGTYDGDFAKNKFILNALRQNSVEIVEIHKQVSVTPLNTKRHMAPWRLVSRLGLKLLLLPLALHNIRKIRSCDAILVGYPGHFDVPFAAIVSWITRVPLFFDPVLMLTKTFTESVPIMKKGSILYLMLLWFERGIYALPRVIFTETAYTKEYLHKTYGIAKNKIQVLYLGADDAIYKKKSGIGGKKLLVTYYGMFIQIHGVPVIVEAADLLRNEANIEFQMIGRGPLYEQTVSEIQKRNLKNITLLPHVTEANAFEYLAKGSVFLGFLTDSELVQMTIPNKVYQGFAMGQVVIKSDTKVMNHHFVDKKNIVLVPPDDARALARALLWLNADKKRMTSIAEEGYAEFVKHYSPQAIGKTLVDSIKAHARQK